MSKELFIFEGILLGVWGLDEYLPAKQRVPIKLVVGGFLFLVGLYSTFVQNGIVK